MIPLTFNIALASGGLLRLAGGRCIWHHHNMQPGSERAPSCFSKKKTFCHPIWSRQGEAMPIRGQMQSCLFLKGVMRISPSCAALLLTLSRGCARDPKRQNFCAWYRICTCSTLFKIVAGTSINVRLGGAKVSASFIQEGEDKLRGVRYEMPSLDRKSCMIRYTESALRGLTYVNSLQCSQTHGM